MYCKNCGKEVSEKAVICVACGVPLKDGVEITTGNTQGKDWLTTLLFCIFLGWFGIHRFYTGHIVIGVIQLFTFGGWGIWTIIDFIMIVSGSFKDSKGNLLVKR